MNPEQAKQKLKDSGVVGVFSSAPEVIHERPAGYNDEEWLSYIYYLEWCFNSAIKNRRAPEAFIQRFLPTFTADAQGRNVIKDTTYAPIRDFIHEKYAEENPDVALTLHRAAMKNQKGFVGYTSYE